METLSALAEGHARLRKGRMGDMIYLVLLLGGTLFVCWLCKRANQSGADKAPSVEVPSFEETPGLRDQATRFVLKTILGLVGAALSLGLLALILWQLVGRQP